MARVVVDISSLVRWNKLLATEAATIAARVQNAVAAEAIVVEQRALSDAPELTGALRGSIRQTGGGLRRRVTAGSGLRRSYAPFQEFGTRKMAAHPFLITQHNEQTIDEFERKVEIATFAGQLLRGGL